ncbi:MAG: hypothetical protein ACYDBH_12285 [Acidobacteriaceae bacterium]
MAVPLFDPDGGPAPPGGLPNLGNLPPVAHPQPVIFGGPFVTGAGHRTGTVMVLAANQPQATPGGFQIGQGTSGPAWPLL